MKILHVVRRYGPVGGMERYVWETTRELLKLGHEVQVICEVCVGDAAPGIVVHELGRMHYRPRWLYYWRFSRRVHAWLKAHPQPGWLIHSNERVGMHDVTTFHGPPFASVRDKPWWKKVSIRVAMQLWMERRELKVAKAIVPNSEIIKQQLAHYYPEYADKLTVPIVPGVVPGVVRYPRKVPEDGGIIGFVGREWQRKGLPLAVEIAAQLRRTRPNLELWVVGPEPHEIEHLFKGNAEQVWFRRSREGGSPVKSNNWIPAFAGMTTYSAFPRDWNGGYRLLGWRTDNAHFENIDVLLHPAKAEPYGMVISEAMAARVPVVVSDMCGAAEQVSDDAGTVLALQAPLEKWTRAVTAQLDRAEVPQRFVRGWNLVAKEFLGIYSGLLNRWQEK